MGFPRKVGCVLIVLASTSLWPQSEGTKPTDKASENTASQPASRNEASPASVPESTASSPGDSTKLEPLKIQKATYPAEAAEKQIQGQVWVKLLVSETGDIENVEVVSGDPILAKATVDAVKKWKFKPFIKNGKPVKVFTKMPLDFAFSDKIADTRPPVSSDNATTQKRVQVAQGVSLGLLVHKVTPVYPAAARQDHVQGVVLLRAVIGKDGRIQELTPISGPKELVGAAIGAVQQWRYKPYMLNNEPVEVETHRSS
jgi:TonB family protein